MKIYLMLSLIGFIAAAQSPAVPHEAVEKMAEGQEKLAQGNLGSALDYFKAAAALAPEWAKPQVYIGLTHLKKDSTKKALRVLEKAIEIFPDDDGVRHALAATRLLQRFPWGQDLGPKRALRVARVLSDESDIAPLATLANVLPRDRLAQGEAFEHLAEAMIELRSPWTELWLDEWERAVPDMKTVAQCYRGYHYLETGQGDAARSVHDRLLATLDQPGQVMGSCNEDFLVHFGSHLEEPKLLSGNPPQYTPEAANQRLSGRVAFEGIVTLAGRFVQPRLLSGQSGPGSQLSELAISTVVNEWRFSPAHLNGKPVAFRTFVEVTFRLR